MLSRLLCFALGHRYAVWQHFGHSQRRVVCHRCKSSWGMHDGCKTFVPWDGEIAEMYNFSGFRIRPWTIAEKDQQRPPT